MFNKTRYTWTKSFKNGDTYDGEAVGDNVKDGKGTYVWASTGARYSGDWSNGLQEGQGTLEFPGVDGFTYKGAFVKGKREGKGECVFQNGRVYRGEWKDDQMDGAGVLQGSPSLDDFAEYSGPFVCGFRSGARGVCRYLNGNVYEGNWLKGKRSGIGELRFGQSTPKPARAARSSSSAPAVPDISTHAATVCYKGPFENDAPKAVADDGVFTYADGASYRGGAAQMGREGKGEYRTSAGDVFIGTFKGDRPDGSGALRCADGSSYQGTWRAGQMSGTVLFKRGASVAATSTASPAETITQYSGPVEDGEFTGPGAKVTFGDGSYYTGDVRRGQPNGNGKLENRKADALPVEVFGHDVVLVEYTGPFFNGMPEGEGRGVVQVPSTVSASGGGNSPRRASSVYNEQQGPPLPPDVIGLQVSHRRNGVYVGGWSQGVPQGQGCWTWDSGDVYRGEVACGVAQGQGTYKSASETYAGSFVDGVPGGRGTYENVTYGITYEGSWRDGLADGTGTASFGSTSATAVEYEGEFRMGRRHGKGREVRRPDDVVYEGDFDQGQWSGRGVLKAGDGLTYEGEFYQDAVSGEGVMTLANGTTVEGHFLNSEPHGAARVHFPQLDLKFEGTYEHGAPVGTGTITYPNGDVYRGGVERANPGDPSDWTPQRHGQGVFRFSEGNELTCTWRHNVLHGEGTYVTAATGERSTRHYADGALATNATKADDVFSPENMFPNTQSEEVLKEKMNAKPFKFVRKGETKQAANANGQPPVNPDGGASQPKPSSKRGSLSSGRLDGGAKPHANARKMSSASTPQAAAPKLRDRPTSIGGSTPAAERRDSATTATKRSSVLALERFQNNIQQLSFASEGAGVTETTGHQSTESRATASSSLVSPTKKRNESAAREGASGAFAPYTSVTKGTDGGRVRGPLKGNLKKLMEDASAIRSSKEDEIYNLTEEIRELNEKIWQLRFSINTTEGKGGSSSSASHHAQRLEAMQDERKNAVEKLQHILSH